MTSPTARTLAALRASGLMAQVVERYNPYARKRIDVGGFGDILAWGADADGPRILLVQATSGANLQARVDKIKTECRSAARAWLASGGDIEVWGWRRLKVKRGGKARRWAPAIVRVEDGGKA